MKKIRLKIVGLASGEPSEFDNKYVKSYNPHYHPPNTDYDGGWLEVTEDLEEARTFETAHDALECWRQSHGQRSDGQLNRPLTAFTVEVS